MRFLLVFASICMAFAQDAPKKYLVEFTVDEPCYACTMTCNAIYPESCPTPTQPVSHYREFSTIKDAVRWINGGMYDEHVVSLSSGIIQPYWRGPAKFVRLLATNTIQLDKHVDVQEDPQPPVRKETVKYSYQGDDGGEIAGILSIRGDLNDTGVSGHVSFGNAMDTTSKFVSLSQIGMPVTPKAGDCFVVTETGVLKYIDCPKPSKAKR